MLLLNQKTLLEKILDKEFNDFKKEWVNQQEITTEEETMVDGAVLFKVPINKSSIKELLEDYRIPATLPVTARNFEYLFNNVSTKVLNIPIRADLKTCINEIATYRSKLGIHFYGALLRERSTKSIINPLHVLTTLAMLSNDIYSKASKYDILIYIYSNRDDADATYNSDKADKEKITKSIDLLISQYSNRLITEEKIVSIEELKHSPGVFKVKKKRRIHPDEDINAESYISVHQAITNGIAIPYYGTSIVSLKNNGNTTGTPLSPFRSANIQSSNDNINNVSSIPDGSVCTGSQSNRTLKGLRTLTHSNVLSPYSRNNIIDGALIYADMMIDRAFDFFYKAGYLTNPVTVQEIKWTPTDDELDCVTLKDYMSLKGYTLPDLFKAQKEWERIQQWESNNQ